MTLDKAIYNAQMWFFVEFFPKQRFSATNRFRTSLRGRRFQVPPDNYFEEIDSTVKERMKQYRGQNESSEK